MLELCAPIISLARLARAALLEVTNLSRDEQGLQEVGRIQGDNLEGTGCGSDSHDCAAQENAARLKAYKAKLVIFPTRSNKPKSGDSTAEELKVAQQHKGPLLPLVHAAHKLESVKLTDELKVNPAGCSWSTQCRVQAQCM